MAAEPSNSDVSPYAGLASKIRSGQTPARAEYEQRPPSLKITFLKQKQPVRFFNPFRMLLSLLSARVSVAELGVELDGVIVGTLEVGKTIQIETTAGEHRLRIVSWSRSSSVRVLQLTNGQNLRFSCLPSMFSIVLNREH